MRQRDGVRVTGIVLYELSARQKGVAAHDLPLDERQALAARASRVLFPGFEVIGEARPPEPVEIVPYDPAWPVRYASWRARLEASIGATAERTEHVGSTSVPELPAKPIVDVQVSVHDLANEGRYLAACESLGLQLRSRDDERRYFQPVPGHPREVHVHVCSSGSRWERRTFSSGIS